MTGMNDSPFFQFVKHPGEAIVFSITSIDQMLLGLLTLKIIDHFGSLTSIQEKSETVSPSAQRQSFASSVASPESVPRTLSQLECLEEVTEESGLSIDNDTQFGYEAKSGVTTDNQTGIKSTRSQLRDHKWHNSLDQIE